MHTSLQAIKTIKRLTTTKAILYVDICFLVCFGVFHPSDLLALINTKITTMNLPRFTDCGLNADWSVEAIHYGTNKPNYEDGDLYVIENEARGTFDIVKYFPSREENRVECLLENITKQQRAKSIIHAHWHKNN